MPHFLPPEWRRFISLRGIVTLRLMIFPRMDTAFIITGILCVWLREGTVGVLFRTLTEVDIALGNFSRLYTAAEEAARDGYKNILLLPSSIGSVLGFDFKAYAEDISRVSGVKYVHAPVKTLGRFLQRARSLSVFHGPFCRKRKVLCRIRLQFAGGDATYQAQCDHIYLSELIESSFGLKLNIDSTRNERVEAWKHIGNAKINIVTSRYAVRTAEY